MEETKDSKIVRGYVYDIFIEENLYEKVKRLLLSKEKDLEALITELLKKEIQNKEE